MEFLLFNAGLKDYSYSLKLENPGQGEALKLLKDARGICLQKMFSYAPINADEIRKLTGEAHASGIEDAAKHLQSIKPSEIEARLKPFVSLKQLEGESNPLLPKKKGDPIDFAWSCYLYFLLEKTLKTSLPPQTDSRKELRLASNYKGWVAIKKCDASKAEDKEVLASLVGIYATLAKKIPEYASSDYAGLEAFADKAFAAFPERKSFARLPLALLEAEKSVSEAKKFFPEGREEEALKYLLDKACARCGFTPFISIEAINGNYPELKIPKPKGNYGKKKKA
jgi:hypothetical protein